MRIVVVDDVEENRYFLEVLLRGHGYEVVSTRNGEEALAELQRAGADLVIADILMPVMDGYQLCRAVKEDVRLASIPLVFYTATYTSDADRNFALGLGACRFIVKPAEPGELVAIIREVLAEAERGHLAAAEPAVAGEPEFHREHDLRVTRKLEKKIRDLQESEERYRTLFATSPDPLFVYEVPTGRFLDANPAACQLYGYAHEELLRMTNVDLSAEPERTARATSGGVEFVPIRNHRKKDGTVFPVEIRASYRVQDGLQVSVASIRDIGPRLRAEEEEAVLRRQLEQAQKMEAVGRLAGGIAHDFNNLLTIILGRANLALGASSTEGSVRTDLEEIQAAAERAAALTSQLLVFSRKQVLRPRIVDLSEVVESVGKMLRRLIGEDVDVVTVLSRELPAVRVDPGQMEQVILNLCVNARDAMPRGGRLTLETAEVSLDDEYASRHPDVVPGRYVMLAVSDTGTGMDAETQVHIFEPFFTTKEPGKGTGLGLSVAHGIVQQSGGSIWVESEMGKGTTFKIYLPPTPERAGTGLVVIPVSIPRGDETILLVEDESAVRRLAALILRSNGYTVLEAGSGDEALSILSKAPGLVHLLLTDFVMPHMSGRELAERVHAARPSTRILYMSGYTDIGQVGSAPPAPSDVLQKPFTMGMLTQKVRDVLGRS